MPLSTKMDSFDESFIDGRVTFEDFLPNSDKENDSTLLVTSEDHKWC